MRRKSKEDLNSWFDRSKEYQLAIAKKQLNNNKDPYFVIERFTDALIKKYLDYIYQELKTQNNYDIEKCKLDYQKNYLEKIKESIDKNQEK